VGEKLGSGNYAYVYECVEMRSNNGAPLALKLEKFPREGQLERDVTFLTLMRDSPAVPSLICEGKHDGCSFFVMEQGGKNLHDFQVWQSDKKRHLMKEELVYAIGYCCLWALEQFHLKGHIHRDIKLANFLIACDPAAGTARISLVDFGLAKPLTKEESPAIPGKFRGTTSYASINCHGGKHLSRRDDLWSLFYILIELYSGSLRWREMSNVRSTHHSSHHSNHHHLKERDRKAEVLSIKRKCANSFQEYFVDENSGKKTVDLSSPYLRALQQFEEMVKKLEFGSEPDYKRMQELFRAQGNTSRCLFFRQLHNGGFAPEILCNGLIDLHLWERDNAPKINHQQRDRDRDRDGGHLASIPGDDMNMNHQMRAGMLSQQPGLGASAKRKEMYRGKEWELNEPHRNRDREGLVSYQGSRDYKPENPRAHQAMAAQQKKRKSIGNASAATLNALKEEETSMLSDQRSFNAGLHAFGKLTPVEKYLYTSHYIKEDLPKCGGDYTRRILFQLSEQITEALQNLRE
jgi:serine/threonine protein kinase